MANPINHDHLFDQLGPGAQELAEYIKQVQALNRNYRAFAKNLDADAPRLASALSEVNQSLTALRQQAQGANVVNAADRQQIQQLTAEVAKLAREQRNLKDAQAGQAAVRKQVRVCGLACFAQLAG